MLSFYPITVDHDFTRDDLLYVGHFFKLKNMQWKKRKQRQGLILSIAYAWYHIVNANPNAPGFLNEEIFLTSLTKQVKDAKVILEYFFDIKRIGFNFSTGDSGPTLVSPKRLNRNVKKEIHNLLNKVRYNLPEIPNDANLVQSKVAVDKQNIPAIRAELKNKKREDLLPAINWLAEQESLITFYYAPAGSLMARDKSVWPIAGIESWPGWLRTSLFGRVVDIENAYCQFLVKKLEMKYKNNMTSFELKFKDLIRSDRDKHNFRNDLCVNYLKLEPTDENINVIKKILMSLANGSNITSGLLMCNSTRSEAAKIILANCPHLKTEELIAVGNRFAIIARQFKAAKKDLCMFLLNEKPSRINQKKIFRMYFMWERECRYAIWNSIGKSGLMLHDGIDGIINEQTNDDLVTFIEQQTTIRVSVDSPPVLQN